MRYRPEIRPNQRLALRLVGQERRCLVFVVVVTLALTSLPAFAAEPLASAYTNWDDVSLDLMAVERRGNVLTVKWAVNNEGDSGADVSFALKGQAGAYVVDEESGTKLFVLTDKEGACLASQSSYISSNKTGITGRIEPGKTKRYWMKLPAPAPEVKQVTVFFDGTEPLEGIAIKDL